MTPEYILWLSADPATFGQKTLRILQQIAVGSYIIDIHIANHLNQIYMNGTAESL